MNQEEAMQKNKKAIESFGLEYGGDLIPENFEGDRRVVKVNLPRFFSDDWSSGNGEGCWAYIKNEEDLEKYDSGRGDFEVILLNASVYYIGLLLWGAVITVEGRGPKNRPVLKRDWVTPIFYRADKDEEAEQEE